MYYLVDIVWLDDSFFSLACLKRILFTQGLWLGDAVTSKDGLAVAVRF